MEETNSYSPNLWGFQTGKLPGRWGHVLSECPGHQTPVSECQGSTRAPSPGLIALCFTGWKALLHEPQALSHRAFRGTVLWVLMAQPAASRAVTSVGLSLPLWFSGRELLSKPRPRENPEEHLLL